MRRSSIISRGGFVAALVLLALTLARPAEPQAINSKSGLALKGYDAVAYFDAGKAVAGNRSFTYTWHGLEWRFANAANRDAFAAAPDKYAPQYGGFCAWAVANNYTADIDPEAFRVVDGKLYLNYSKSVQSTWQRDIAGNISKGDGNWPKLSTTR